MLNICIEDIRGIVLYYPFETLFIRYFLVVFNITIGNLLYYIGNHMLVRIIITFLAFPVFQAGPLQAIKHPLIQNSTLIF